MDVLFKRKDVSGYPWFGSRDVQGSEGKDIPVKSKYLLPSKLRDVEGKPCQHPLFPNLPSFKYITMFHLNVSQCFI